MYTKATYQFLEDLVANNNRDWFAENKSRYLQNFVAPSLELIEQLEKPLRRVAPFLSASTAKSGCSLMRIYRDTRFASDKTPYKTNIGIQLRHQAGKDVHAPCIYLHFAADESFVGAGCYRPEPAVLAKIRTKIDEDGKAWLKSRDEKWFREIYKLAGESLKTTPRDYARNHPLIDDLRRKDFIAVSPLTRQQVLTNDLIETLVQRIRSARPLMRFLCDAIGVPY